MLPVSQVTGRVFAVGRIASPSQTTHLRLLLAGNWPDLDVCASDGLVLTKVQQALDPETEVEVLVMAYHSYVQAGRCEGDTDMWSLCRLPGGCQGCCERSVTE